MGFGCGVLGPCDALRSEAQESDKFVGIDMDVKEILMNGFQVRLGFLFQNPGNPKPPNPTHSTPRFWGFA